MMTEISESPVPHFLAFDQQPCREKLKHQANVNLGETEELREQSLKELKALIKEHAVHCITEDDFILPFLRSRKFDVERSFKVLQNYVTQRKKVHDLLLDFTPEALKVCLEKAFLGILPYRDSDGGIIVFHQSGIWRKPMCSDMDFVLSAYVVYSYVARDESSQIVGIRTIIDERNNRFSDIIYMLRHAPFLRSFLFNSLAIRHKNHHILNEPAHYRIWMKLIRPFLPEKLIQRVILHGEDRKELFQRISPSVVPTQFGGNLNCSFGSDKLIETMLAFLEKLKEEQWHFIKEESFLKEES